MTPPNDDNETDFLAEDQEEGSTSQEKGRSGKGKAGGAGAGGIARSDISPAFFQLMTRFGASMDQITRIMRDWSHLTGETLLHTVAAFARDIARASAQPLVAFDGDYGLITNFLMHLRGKTAHTPQSRPPGYEGRKPGPR